MDLIAETVQTYGNYADVRAVSRRLGESAQGLTNMIAKLAALFIIVPILELFVLIPLAGQIGFWPTLAIISVTGIVGAWLGKRQGLDAFRRIRSELAAGGLPGDAMMDGVLVLVACTLLLTPGVLTDAVGLALLIPPARLPLKAYLRRRFTKMLQNPNVTVIDVPSFGTRNEKRTSDDGVIDITPSSERQYTLADH